MKSTQKKLIVCLSCLLMLLSMVVGPASANEVRTKAEILKEVDDFVLKNMKVNHIKGAAVAISNKEDVFYAQGYGANSDGRGISASTAFPIASLSKSFTAFAVLQMVEQGRIDLDSPYTSYFPEQSPEDERVHDITVRQLLNQTSGLNDKVNPDFTNDPQYQSLQEVNRSLSTIKLAHNPGEVYSYHNPNYQYLALLVEKVSGQSFSDYLKKNVFDPLEMSHTYNVSTTTQIHENPAIPKGHYLLLGQPVSMSEPSWFIDGPAGIISTAEDMAKWMVAQNHARLLAPELMEQFHAAGKRGPYGMGWTVEEDQQWGRTISHSGIFWTYKAEESIYLDQQFGIAVMFNTGLNAFVDYSFFVDGIARIIKGDKVEAPILNSRNLETVMMLLIIGTLLWGGYAIFRLMKSKKDVTTGKLIISSVGRLLPVLIFLFLSPLVTFIGAGRVLPWLGLWTTMPSLIIWLSILCLVNITNLICRYRLYYRTKESFES